jgi:hypothetical protein
MGYEHYINEGNHNAALIYLLQWVITTWRQSETREGEATTAPLTLRF